MDHLPVTISRTLQLALGAAAIVCLVVVYSFGAPPLPVLLGALAAILWITGKAAWRRAKDRAAGRRRT